MDTTLSNPNPTIYKTQKKGLKEIINYTNDIKNRKNYTKCITTEDVYNLLRNINDPEYPLKLEQLHIVQEEFISIDQDKKFIKVEFAPTIPHCSMAILIGLCIRVKLQRSLPMSYKVDIFIRPGTHVSELQINKQLNDKERIAAALENEKLLLIVDRCTVIVDFDINVRKLFYAPSDLSFIELLSR